MKPWSHTSQWWKPWSSLSFPSFLYVIELILKKSNVTPKIHMSVWNFIYKVQKEEKILLHGKEKKQKKKNKQTYISIAIILFLHKCISHARVVYHEVMLTCTTPITVFGGDIILIWDNKHKNN